MESALKKMLRYLLCGMIMGGADVVPGISGGTMAFLLGIYPRLLDAIQSFNLDFLRRVMAGRFREAAELVPWSFLLPLGAGILVSIFTLANGVLHVMRVWPVMVWSFFFGLILASVAILFRETGRKTLPVGAAFMAGGLFAWWLAGLGGLGAMEAEPGFPVYFASAFLAVCAMLLPGISGASLLILLGQYQYVIRAVAVLDMPVLLVFAAGCVCGLLSFARILSALLCRFPAVTLALLAGIMCGSLRAVWPWQQAGYPSLPPALDGSVLAAALFCCAGIALPVVLQALAGRSDVRRAQP